MRMRGCLYILRSTFDLDVRVGEGQSLAARAMRGVIESANSSDVEAGRASAGGYGRRDSRSRLAQMTVWM